MIHSRPGYAPRASDEVVAKLNADMIPAINRGERDATTPLKQALQSKAESAFAKLKAKQEAVALAEAQAIAAKVGPDLLINPAPSVPPRVIEPGK
jgi:hypothetical protein